MSEKGVVERPPFLLPHVEDGALLYQAGQRFLCAGADGFNPSAEEMACARRKANCSLYCSNFTISRLRWGVILGGYCRCPALPSR